MKTILTNKMEKDMKQTIVYTQEQTNAINKIVDFVKNSSGQIRLVGSAGCGKSTCLEAVVEQVAALSIPITIIAPTHKAKAVAGKFINRNRDPNDPLANWYEPLTLAKALGNVPKVIVEDGKQRFIQAGKPTQMSGLIILDEASMLSQYSLEKLEELVAKDSTLLFVLDPVQLPPVKSNKIPVINLDIEEATLTTPQRFYSNSTIGKFTTAIRGKDSQLSNFPWGGAAQVCKDASDVHFYTSKDKFEEEYITALEDNDWLNNPESVRLVTWKNNDVDYYNKLVTQLYLDNPNPSSFVANEVLIARSPFIRTDPRSTPLEVFNATKDEIIHYINNGAEYRLIDLESVDTFIHPKYKDKPVEYQVWSAETEEGESFTSNIVSVKGKRNYKFIYNDLHSIADKIPDSSRKKKGKAWGARDKFKNSFDNCRRAYALTVHSSQGGTFNNVFIDLSFLNDAKCASIRRALIYTALTRASETLHIYIPATYVGKNVVDTIR